MNLLFSWACHDWAASLGSWLLAIPPHITYMRCFVLCCCCCCCCYALGLSEEQQAVILPPRGAAGCHSAAIYTCCFTRCPAAAAAAAAEQPGLSGSGWLTEQVPGVSLASLSVLLCTCVAVAAAMQLGLSDEAKGPNLEAAVLAMQHADLPCSVLYNVCRAAWPVRFGPSH
jgi:hypothetical protein